MTVEKTEHRVLKVPGAAAPLLAYTLVRSKRRSVSLTVQRSGELVVRSPLRTPVRSIERFIAEKYAWIERTQSQMAQTHAATEAYLDALARSGEDRSALLERVRAEARQVLTLAVVRRAAELGLHYHTIKITSARTRWGSCSSRGTLSFTWRLALCPPEVRDYVVVHELCHLTHHNHGEAFWATVAAACPAYQQQRKWLKAHRALLDIVCDTGTGSASHTGDTEPVPVSHTSANNALTSSSAHSLDTNPRPSVQPLPGSQLQMEFS